jgi:heptosyltransferase-2
VIPRAHPRLLVLRGGAIGDFVATLPALHALRARWPGAYIELVGYPHVARLALAGGLVDRVASLDAAGIARFFACKPMFTAEQVEHVRSFDLVVCYLHDPEDCVVRNLELAGARQVIRGDPIVKAAHAVDHLLRPLEALAIYPEGVEAPRLDVPEELRAFGAGWLRERGAGVGAVALHPGSGSARKNWPAARFAGLARRIREAGRARPVFVVGEADAEAEATLRALSPDAPFAAGLDLPHVVGLLSQCRAYAGNDSGITHLAAALGLPVVALFGPSDPALWGPRGPGVRILRAPGGDPAALAEADVWDALRVFV